MRIVGGALKGRVIESPRGRATRPTSARAREAMFNVLAHAPWAPPLAGARVLDMFAGTGALGFEALSRGASFCLFVDDDAAARAAIRTNAEAFDMMGRARIHRRDATRLGDKPAALGAPFDLLFLDPPYGEGLAATALDRVLRGDWVSETTCALVELGEVDPDPEPTGWRGVDVRSYGAARVLFYVRGDAA